MAGGRPAEFETVEEFNLKVDEYFEFIKGEFEWKTDSDEEGNPIDVKVWTRSPEPSTITGLCLFLGFESRQSFHDYGKREQFSYAIKRARLRIENEYEKSLNISRTPTAQIFALKNLGWKDTQALDHSSSDGTMSPTPIRFTKGSND